MEVGGQRHAPSALPMGERPCTDLGRARFVPGPVWTGAENLAPTGIRSPDRSARRQSQYRLSYPGDWTCLFQLSYTCKRGRNFTTALQMAQLSFGAVFIFLHLQFSNKIRIYAQWKLLSVCRQKHMVVCCASSSMYWRPHNSFSFLFFQRNRDVKICHSNIRTVAWNQLHSLFRYSDWCPHLCMRPGVGAEEQRFWEYACGTKWWEVSVRTTWGRATEPMAHGTHIRPIYYYFFYPTSVSLSLSLYIYICTIYIYIYIYI